MKRIYIPPLFDPIITDEISLLSPSRETQGTPEDIIQNGGNGEDAKEDQLNDWGFDPTFGFDDDYNI